MHRLQRLRRQLGQVSHVQIIDPCDRQVSVPLKDWPSFQGKEDCTVLGLVKTYPKTLRHREHCSEFIEDDAPALSAEEEFEWNRALAMELARN